MADPILAVNRAVTDLGVRAYAGIPIVAGRDHAVGTLCVLDVRPRDWTSDGLAQLALLASIIDDKLSLERP